jgi:Zn-dependent protease
MLLNYLSGAYNTTDLIIVAVVMIFALVFHNVVQAWVAGRLGDPSPRFAGFLRFEPQQHLEPFGVLFLFLLGFGWPKPVAVNSRNYGGRGRQEALVWYSGPLAYLLIALGAVIVALILTAANSPLLARSFVLASLIAIRHAVINLFPVYPLDGARAALAWGNSSVRRVIQQIASFGVLGFIAIFLVLSYTGVLGALERFFFSLIVGILQLIPGL